MVSVPGTAIRFFLISLCVNGRGETIIGPYPSPTLPPQAHQRVLVLNIWISVKRNRGHVVHAFPRLLVQRFDIAKRMRKAQSRDAHFVGRQTIEHERIIGIRAVRHRDLRTWSKS